MGFLDENLSRLGIRNYRSFDNQGVYLDKISKVNLFIGKNNSGKSNVLKFIYYLSKNIKDPSAKIEFADKHHGHKDKPSELFFQVQLSELNFPETVELIISNSTRAYNPYNTQTFNLLQLFENHVEIPYGFGSDKRKIKLTAKPSIDIPSYQLDRIHQQLSKNINAGITAQQQNPSLSDRIQAVLNRHLIPSLFKTVVYIPDIRVINSNIKLENSNADITGQNIVKRIFKMQAHDLGEEGEAAKYEKIQQTARSLTGIADLSLRVPHTQDKILVKTGGKELPIEMLGSGIHEILLLASAIIIHDTSTFCIEEPELHMHPELQRKFFDFLFETEATFFISTHSNVFLDNARDNTSIYHCLHDGTRTTVQRIHSNHHNREVLHDLGYKNSDLIQSNCIIWVEGPSDRIYLNRWIQLCNPDLKEGLHYSIMFYGGRLLSHLTCDPDPENSELIDLLKINKCAYIVIDSDKKLATDSINATKLRVLEEATSHNCWITQGKEIENYLSLQTTNSWLQSRKLQPLKSKLDTHDLFPNALNQVNTSLNYAAHKADFARELIQHINESDLEVLDLKDNLEKLCERIQYWNQL